MQSNQIPGIRNVWAETLGEPSVCIAVLDGPVDLQHPSFAGAAIKVLDTLVCNSLHNGAASRHGTYVASVLFGSHNGPIVGIAPNCRGLIVPVFSDAVNGGVIPCSQLDLAQAILQAASAGAKVINVSGGEYSATGEALPHLRDAVRFCREAGALIVSAAGNDGCDCLHIPGALPSVLVAGAMDLTGAPHVFSNWGANYRKQGVLAPGVGFIGAAPGKGIVERSGTSVAAAVLSGVVALLMSLQIRRGQLPNADAVRRAILASAIGCGLDELASNCNRILAGRLNIGGAVALLFAEQAQIAESSCDVAPVSAENSDNKACRKFKVEEAASVAADVSSPSLSERTCALSALRVVVENHMNLSSQSDSSPEATDAAPSEKQSSTMDAGVRSSSNLAEEAINPRGIVPSAGCGCTGKGSSQLVFAIGQLGIDFVSESRRQSIQQHSASRGDFVLTPANFLRHLLGWSETYLANGQITGPVIHKSHPYDAKAVTWVLTQDNVPVYAIQPRGAFTEEAYHELAEFLMNQSGFDSQRPEQLNIDWNDPKRVDDSLREPLTEFVAIPGTLAGTTKLLTGYPVPVIVPEMRGTSEWHTQGLADLVKAQLSDLTDDYVTDLVQRILDRFKDEIRNPGISGEDRARNYGSTNVMSMMLEVLTSVKQRYKLDQIEIDKVEVVKSRIVSDGLYELYDFSLALFDPSNVNRSTVVISNTIDVSDVAPSVVGPTRISSRR